MTECTFYTYQCAFSTVVANLCSQHCMATQVLAESRLHFLSERNYDVLISRILHAGVDLSLIQRNFNQETSLARHIHLIRQRIIPAGSGLPFL